MIATGVVSIPSSTGSSTVFTVTGTRTLLYAQAFQAYLDAALKAGNLDIQQGDTIAATASVSFAPPVPVDVNEAVLKGAGGALSTTVPGGYQFLFDNYSGISTITGAATGGDVLVAAINAQATYYDEGGNNTVVFVDGNNHYVGDSTSGAGSDTIVAGSGFDTIDTGAGRSTVDSGTGEAVINLHDTIAGDTGTVYNDYVYLDDGMSVVNANGTRDAVVATAPGQVIDGGLSASQTDCIVLLAGSTGDVVNGNGATISLFDSGDGNSIFGGSGQLTFVGEADINASILGGSGTTDIFGGVGDSIVFDGTSTAGHAAFLASAGNETLLGALSQTAMALYGYNGTAASVTSGVQDVLVGGAGNDTLVTGAGHETLTGGGGNNLYLIDATTDGVGGNIVITDFGASSGNLLGFENYSAAEIQSALNNAYTVTGASGETNTILTLSDNTQVTFIGVSTLSGHTIT
jgi:Ca2+-binding RTX toxin-like protein